MNEDTSLPFKTGDPCFVQLDSERRQLIVKRIGKDEAVSLGRRESESEE